MAEQAIKARRTQGRFVITEWKSHSARFSLLHRTMSIESVFKVRALSVQAGPPFRGREEEGGVLSDLGRTSVCSTKIRLSVSHPVEEH